MGFLHFGDTASSQEKSDKKVGVCSGIYSTEIDTFYVVYCNSFIDVYYFYGAPWPSWIFI